MLSDFRPSNRHARSRLSANIANHVEFSNLVWKKRAMTKRHRFGTWRPFFDLDLRSRPNYGSRWVSNPWKSDLIAFLNELIALQVIPNDSTLKMIVQCLRPDRYFVWWLAAIFEAGSNNFQSIAINDDINYQSAPIFLCGKPAVLLIGRCFAMIKRQEMNIRSPIGSIMTYGECSRGSC